MHGPSANDTSHHTFAGENIDTLADQNLRVPTTHPDDPQEPFVVNVMYHQADLISMTGQHYGGCATRIDFCEAVPLNICPGSVCETLSRSPPDSRSRAFMSGWTRCIKQPDKKIARLGIHRYSSC
jgi:hypothetical protein